MKKVVLLQGLPSLSGAISLISLFSALQVYLSPAYSTKIFYFFIFLTILSLFLSVTFLIWTEIKQATTKTIHNLINRTTTFYILITALAIIILGGWIFISLTRESASIFIMLLQPLVIWSIMVSLAGLIFTTLEKKSLKQVSRPQETNFFINTLLFLVPFCFLFLFADLTQIGIKPIGTYWYSPGTPILIQQVLIALLIGYVIKLIETKLRLMHNNENPSIILVGLSIWILTAILWIIEPQNNPTHFNLAPAPPNFDSYPFSDSAAIDINAQRMLIGQGLSLDPQVKPIYSLFIWFLHLVTGQNYAMIATAQSIFLAIIPAIIFFLLTKTFKSYPLGIVAALLIIFREQNSIKLSNIILVSHSKLILSDMPAMGLMVLLVALFCYWLEKPLKRSVIPVLIGTCFGIFILLRGQIIVLLPILIGVVLLKCWKQKKLILLPTSLLFTLGLLAAIIPWMVYSRLKAETITSPGYIRQLAIQYQPSPYDNNRLKLKPGETGAEYTQRLQNQVIDFVREQPREVVHYVTAYFVRNLIQTIQFLPQSSYLENDLRNYVTRLPYWDIWDGKVPPESQIILGITLLMLIFGMANAWQSFKLVGLSPLLIYLGYVTSLAIPMISGWRFLLPVDWIILVYYLLGIEKTISLLTGISLIGTFGKTELPEEALINQSRIPWKLIALLLSGVVLINSIPIFYQPHNPTNFDSLTKTKVLEMYQKIAGKDAKTIPPLSEVEKFLGTPGSTAIYGMVLYPRFIQDSSSSTSYLEFNILSKNVDNIIFPLTEPPSTFPHASEILLLGCYQNSDNLLKKYLEAKIIFLPKENILIQQSPWTGMDCVEQKK